MPQDTPNALDDEQALIDQLFEIVNQFCNQLTVYEETNELASRYVLCWEVYGFICNSGLSELYQTSPSEEIAKVVDTYRIVGAEKMSSAINDGYNQFKEIKDPENSTEVKKTLAEYDLRFLDDELKLHVVLIRYLHDQGLLQLNADRLEA